MSAWHLKRRHCWQLGAGLQRCLGVRLGSASEGCQELRPGGDEAAGLPSLRRVPQEAAVCRAHHLCGNEGRQSQTEQCECQ